MTTDLTARLERLERNLRWALCGWAFTVVLLVSLFFVTPKAFTAPPADRLTVRGLAITDEKGVERIRIAAPLPDAMENGMAQHRRSPANLGRQLLWAPGYRRACHLVLPNIDPNASRPNLCR
jgi:hypothetical protein